MRAIIKSSGEGVKLPLNMAGKIYGQIRMWIEGDPPTPTDIWIVVGDFQLSDDAILQDIKTKDRSMFNSKIQAILNRAKITLNEYGIATRRSFHMDIQVPLQVINAYTR